MTTESFDSMSIPVAEMPPGFMWLRSSMIGLTDDEKAAMMRGEILPERRRSELSCQIECARVALIYAPVGSARV